MRIHRLTRGRSAGLALALCAAVGCDRSTPRPPPDKGNPSAAAGGGSPATRPAAVADAVDPNCHMSVHVGPSTPRATVGGRTYYFCSDDCREQFLHDAAAAATRPAATTRLVVDGSRNPAEERIDRYQPRFGRTRPVVAVLCDNAGTVAVDFAIPYGVLARSGVADVVAVSTGPGRVALGPLHVRAQATTAEFDARYPDGADYVIVPALLHASRAAPAWVAAQSRKGDTTVSICGGATTVADTGLLDGRRATSYFASERHRAVRYPNVRWERNVRYVADGRFVSSAGVTAAIPTSLALVEAIAGHDRAAAVARDLGVAGWTSRHDSDAFGSTAGQEYVMPGLPTGRETVVGIPVANGVDEVALALTAEAYSHTGVTAVCSVGPTTAPITTRDGLVVLPDRVAGGPDPVGRLLPPLPTTDPIRSLDTALADIAAAYGRPTAYGVARTIEYPGFKR